MTLFWDLSIQTPDVLFAGASRLGQLHWSQCDTLAAVCDVSVESGTARLQFESPSALISLGFSIIIVVEDDVLSAQLSAGGPMADGYDATAVPLPAGLPLLLTGLASLGLYSRRRA
ncbi:MAG: VPLPA-CTERM sorting domain-containing protein [Pseudomonadota bacterium]